MFDFSWSEMMLIGGIALVVIGPKDLPKALKTAGMLVRKARGMAREFHNSIDEMIRESELDDVRKSVHEATTIDIDKIEDKRVVMTGPPVPLEATAPPHETVPPAVEPPPDEEPELPLGQPEAHPTPRPEP